MSLTPEQISPRLFVAQRIGALIKVPTSNTMTFNVPFNSETLDPSNQYDTGTYQYTNANYGDYQLNVDIKVRDIYSGGGAISSDSESTVTLLIKRIRSGVTTTVSSMAYNILHNGLGPTPTTSNTLHIQHVSPTLRIDINDIYYCEIIRTVYTGISTGGYAIATNWELQLFTGGLFYNTVINVSLFEGEDIDMRQCVPKNIKKRDFFTSIIKMFNLYIDEDKLVHNQLNIEPRNDFYSAGKTIDWTKKLDISKELVLEPMGQLDAIKYLFTYKEDADYWNKKYKDSHQQVYSEEHKFITNDFLKNTNTTELIFSASPQKNIPATDRIIPQIINVNSAGSIEPVTSFNIRILYYGGEITTTTAWTFQTSAGLNGEITYPYCGMVDVPTSPTLSLDFGVPIEIYYNTATYTNNNLYNIYYKQFIEEITDKDSKIVTGWFALTPADILKLDFRNQFFVDGHLLRLNKIFDYNPTLSQVTKCEFIKIKIANSFVAQSIPIGSWGNDYQYADGTATPIPLSPSVPHIFNNNFISTNNNIVGGTVRNTIVTGTRNYIGEGGTDISILNSTGISVMPNLTGVTILNSSGITVTESNVTYIQGLRIIDATSFDLYKTKDNITAYAGGGQADAIELTAERNIIDTVATTGDSVKCDLATVGKSKTIFNNGANDLYLYPAVGDGFQYGSTSIGANLKIVIAAGNTVSMVCYTDKLWRF